MPGKKPEVPADISRMSFDEKLKLLSQADKDYLEGYIDKALSDTSGKYLKTSGKKEKPAKSGPRDTSETSCRRFSRENDPFEK